MTRVTRERCGTVNRNTGKHTPHVDSKRPTSMPSGRGGEVQLSTVISGEWGSGHITAD